MYNLIKKDLLIIKKYIPIIIGISIALPLALSFNIPQHASQISYGLMLVYTNFNLFVTIMQKEEQYKKASSLVASLPYSRKEMVCSRYVLFVLVSVMCFLIYWIETIIIPRLYMPEPQIFFIFFAINSLIYSVYMPVYYKIGFDKMKIIYIAVLMISPMIFPKLISPNNVNMSFMNSGSLMFVCGMLLIVGIGVLYASMILSVEIFKSKELI